MSNRIREIVRSRWWRVAAGSVAVLASLALGSYMVTEYRQLRARRPAPVDREFPAFDRFHLKGVQHSVFRDGVKVFSLEAAEITHKKRRLGPLTVNILKEVVMRDVRIEYDWVAGAGAGAPPSGPSPAALEWLVEETVLHEGLGLVTRVLIEGIDLRFLRDGEEELTISAGRVTMDFVGSEALFQDGLTVTCRSGPLLRAREAEWTGGDGFRVRGPYMFEDAGVVSSGVGGRFGIDPSGKLKRD